MPGAFRNVVEGGVPVDLVGGRVEERVLLVRARRADRGGRYHPDGHAFLPAGVDVAGVVQRDLRVGGVQAADVYVRQAPPGPHEHLPELAVAAAHETGSRSRCFPACASAASRTQAPSAWAARRLAI